MSIPYARLNVPQQVRKTLDPDSPKPGRMALAQGLLPTTTDVQLGICYILATQKDQDVRDAARETMAALPLNQVIAAVNHQSHPKIIEFLAEFRDEEPELDERLVGLRSANDRTARLIARRAESELCNVLARHQERLLLTPDVFIDLHGNENCSDEVLYTAEAFLRMHRSLPEVPDVRPFRVVAPAQGDQPRPPEKPAIDLEAEIMAALTGQQSPTLLAQQASELKMFDLDNVEQDGAFGALGGFSFDFDDEDGEFSWDLTGERADEVPIDKDEMISLEAKVHDLTVGKKIKLAYMGNKSVRNILIRDTNSIVSCAVIKSGRCSDGEIASYAGNRNLGDDVIREIARNREYLRKYNTKLALANNPKCPVPLAVSLINSLHKRDLKQLARNRNVPSVVFQTANRLFKKKYTK